MLFICLDSDFLGQRSIRESSATRSLGASHQGLSDWTSEREQACHQIKIHHHQSNIGAATAIYYQAKSGYRTLSS